MQEKIKVAVVGLGNIGKHAVEAINASPDMKLAGVVRRKVSKNDEENKDFLIVDDLSKLDCDVALFCLPSLKLEAEVKKALEMGINTVDSFDVHTSINQYMKNIKQSAIAGNSSAIISAGWDPGSDSVMRLLMEACAPKGYTTTTFGPGMSMGHSVAAKTVKGVKDAISMTIPDGAGVHKRVVYVELEDGADFEKCAEQIKCNEYFCDSNTRVIQSQDIESLKDVGHGVQIDRNGVSGITHNQRFSYSMTINNPALTSQLMVSCARACIRQKPGVYTMIDLPLIDLIAGKREDAINRLV